LDIKNLSELISENKIVRRKNNIEMREIGKESNN
jgi:hypothetical protein